MVDTDTDEEFEQEDEIKQFPPRKIRGKETPYGSMDYRIALTDAIKFMGLTKEEVGDISFRIDPDEVDGEDGDRMIPCYYFSSDSVPDGRKSDLYRRVRTNTQPGGEYSYQLMVPHAVLDALGYDSESCDGRIINIYASETGFFALGEVESREIETNINTDK